MTGLAAVSAVAAALMAASMAAGVALVLRLHVGVQAAADAAALAAVLAAPMAGGDGDSCTAAVEAAGANGATLAECSAPPGGWALRVRVRAVVPFSGLGVALPALSATAAAELAPEAATFDPLPLSRA